MYDLRGLKTSNEFIRSQISNVNNRINGMSLDDYIYRKVITRVDPIQYCERILRDHLPEKKKHLHENQIYWIRAVCNPRMRKVAALMAYRLGPYIRNSIMKIP